MIRAAAVVVLVLVFLGLSAMCSHHRARCGAGVAPLDDHLRPLCRGFHRARIHVTQPAR